MANSKGVLISGHGNLEIDDDCKRSEKRLKKLDQEEIDDMLRACVAQLGEIKEYVICMPNTNGPNQIAVIRRITVFDQETSKPPHYEIQCYPAPRKAHRSKICNRDGTPILAGYVFGDIQRFRNIRYDVSEAHLTDVLAAEVSQKSVKFDD